MPLMEINFVNCRIESKELIFSFLNEWENNSDSFLVKTSGSTGIPKEMKLPKTKMILSAKTTLEFLKILPNEKALLCLSLNTIAGKMMVVRSMIGNLDLNVVEPSENPLKDIDFQIDFIAIVPAQLKFLIENSPEKFTKIRNVIVGGGEVSELIIQKLKDLKISVYQTFGMTETISHVAMRKIGFEGEEFYTAIAENYFTVEENQLVIHSPILDINPLTTNDLVELVNEKQFIWKGRVDFVINSGGYKFFPEEIEGKIGSIIKTPYFISSEKDEKLGEKLVLNVLSENDKDEKFDFDEYLTRYEKPKIIYFYKHFEYTESNKINRKLTIEKHKVNAVKQIL